MGENIIITDELQDLEFLTGKSKEFIEKQVGAYRQRQTKSGSIKIAGILITRNLKIWTLQ